MLLPARMSAVHSLLEVEDLTVRYCPKDKEQVVALSGVSFEVAPRQVAGLLGESGCGKTTLGLAIPQLLPPHARVERGAVRFCGNDLMTLSERELEKIRGARISMIFQEPGIALHPMLPVGEQIADVIRAHRSWSGRRCRKEAEAMLAQVHLADVGRIYAAYPHQLSGGQRQRVVIAQALACRPELVIADEPTASLDAVVQAEILALLKELRETCGMAMLLISHDPAVLAELADYVMVMHAGEIVEQGSLSEVYAHPQRWYTRSLLQHAYPQGEQSLRGLRPQPKGQTVHDTQNDSHPASYAERNRELLEIELGAARTRPEGRLFSATQGAYQEPRPRL